MIDSSIVIKTITEVLGGSAGTWLSTEIIKFLPVPVDTGQTARIRATAGVFSALSVVLMAMSDHALSVKDVQSVLISLVTFVGVFGFSHLIHRLMSVIRGKDV